MIKVYCDTCGREIGPTVFIGNSKYEKTEVIIHHEGHTLDICKVCQNELARYALEDMRNRAKKARGIVNISDLD